MLAMNHSRNCVNYARNLERPFRAAPERDEASSVTTQARLYMLDTGTLAEVSFFLTSHKRMVPL
jgi:hypothetical protein